MYPDVDVTKLKVMIIEGEGKWIYNNEADSFSWDNGVYQLYGKSAWYWPEPVVASKKQLDAAGVPYEGKNFKMLTSTYANFVNEFTGPILHKYYIQASQFIHPLF